jgi:hypothetical protein
MYSQLSYTTNSFCSKVWDIQLPAAPVMHAQQKHNLCIHVGNGTSASGSNLMHHL